MKVSHKGDYKKARLAEYPPIIDYVDAHVKINSGDKDLKKIGEQELKDYYKICNAIKIKYPKTNKKSE